MNSIYTLKEFHSSLFISLYEYARKCTRVPKQLTKEKNAVYKRALEIRFRNRE